MGTSCGIGFQESLILTEEAIIEEDVSKVSGNNIKDYDASMTEYGWQYRGMLHRRNGYALKWSDDDVWYYLYGHLHRVGGPAAMTSSHYTSRGFAE